MNEKPSVTIKDIRFAKWADHYGNLESMKGSVWKSALRRQAHLFNQVANIPSIKKYRQQFKIINAAAGIEMNLKNVFTFEKLPAYIPNWLRVQDPNFYIYRVEEKLIGVLATYGEKQGSNFYTLGYFPKGHTTPTWTIKNIGADIFVKDNTCYYIEADPITNRDYKLMCCNIKTGGQKHELFIEKDPHKLLLLYPCENQELFFQIENSGSFELYYVDCKANKVQLCDNKSSIQIPCGFLDKPVWISYTESNNKPTLHNCSYKLPNDSMTIYWGAVNRGWLLASAFGNTTLYRWTATSCNAIYSIKAGRILVDSDIEYYHHNKPLIMAAKGVELGVEKLELAEGQLQIKPLPHQDFANKYVAIERNAHSFDGTVVPYHIVKGRSQKKPVALLVYGYGSYGFMTQIHKCVEQFAPLLDIGWAIAFAYIRGGGDDSSVWAAGGRLYNRVRSIEDFEAVILSARGSTGVPAERVVISGRSAGGMLVGSLAARNRDGRLFKGIWAEEPFVDVVTSMANEDYPHTTPEQNEFGDPRRSLTDFMTALEFSPYHRMAGCGAPELFVLARTGENDSQVLAYEPLKWIMELQNADSAGSEGKLFAFGVNQGHHYTKEEDIKARCTDMAILHCWATEPAVREKISTISIKTTKSIHNGNLTRKTTRNNRKSSSRKQRK